MPDYSFHIYFFGLICHVGSASKKYFAAMVRDIDHDPVVYYDNEESYPIDREAVSVKFEIDGVLSAADAMTTPAFRRFVPSLEALMGGSPRGNIEKYAIPVYYPDGETTPLTANAFYKKVGWYIRSGTRWGPDCVAQLTGLEVKAGPKSKLYVVSIDSAGNKTRVNKTPFDTDKNSCLVIGNRPQHAGRTAGHARKYSKILIDEDSQIMVVEPGDCTEKPETAPYCPWVRDWLVRSANDVECGNTNWP